MLAMSSRPTKRSPLQPIGLGLLAISAIGLALTGKVGGTLLEMSLVGFMLGLVLMVAGAAVDEDVKRGETESTNPPGKRNRKRSPLQPVGLGLFAVSGVVLAFTGKIGGALSAISLVGFVFGLVLLVIGAVMDERAKREEAKRNGAPTEEGE
jgi:hypothetical protein